MGLKRDSEEIVVNNKVIERYFDNGKHVVTVYDNDRLKLKYSMEFEDYIEAMNAYNDFIGAEFEKMSHQF